MTELREDQHMLSKDSDGMVLTDLGTATTVGALLQVYLWNQKAHLLSPLDGGFEKEVDIWFFHITIQKQRMGRPERQG